MTVTEPGGVWHFSLHRFGAIINQRGFLQSTTNSFLFSFGSAIFALVLGQKNQLWWDLPAIESFVLLRHIYGLPAPGYQQALDELVDLLDVRAKLNVQVRELSLGERMKMELIAALLHRPPLLIQHLPHHRTRRPETDHHEVVLPGNDRQGRLPQPRL